MSSDHNSCQGTFLLEVSVKKTPASKISQQQARTTCLASKAGKNRLCQCQSNHTTACVVATEIGHTQKHIGQPSGQTALR
jgi:hypothetical protein